MTNLPKLRNNISSMFHTHTSIFKSSSWILHFALHLYFYICSWKYDWKRLFYSMFFNIQKLHTQIKCRTNICKSTISFHNNIIVTECKTFHKTFKTFKPSLHYWNVLQIYYFLLAKKWSSLQGFKPKPFEKL